MNGVLLHDLQSAAIALGVFMCMWGIWELWHCLYEVLMGKHNRPTYSHCPGHATVALICIAGLIFAGARANTIGLIDLGERFSGYAFCGAMIVFTMIVGLSIWAKEKGHAVGASYREPLNIPSLSRIFAMMLIIILAFVLVGLVKAEASV